METNCVECARLAVKNVNQRKRRREASTLVPGLFSVVVVQWSGCRDCAAKRYPDLFPATQTVVFPARRELTAQEAQLAGELPIAD